MTNRALNMMLLGVPFLGEWVPPNGVYPSVENFTATPLTTSGEPHCWDIELSFDPPSGAPAPASYTVEMSIDSGPWQPLTTITASPHTLVSVPDAIYQYRIVAVWASGSSDPEEPNPTDTWINKHFDLSNQYHTLAVI